MITDVRQTTRQGFPMLELKIDGIPATILPWQKPWLVDNGILAVMMLEPGAGELPPVWVPADPSGQAGPHVGWWSDGLVKDPELMKLYLESF